MAVGDRNAKLVHAFTVEMGNLGFDRMADHLVAMLESDAWQSWRDGIGTVELLPGEFDYFLTMCGVTRETVMHGIRDMKTKARLEEAMDERRSGEDGYRRRYDDVRSAVGPRRHAEPFGYTQAEGKALANGSGVQHAPSHREALGSSVRRFAKGGTATAPSRRKPLLDRLEASIRRLDEDELAQLSEWLTQHRRERKRQQG